MTPRQGQASGGAVQQWVDELTAAVREHRAAGFIYRNADEATPDDVALARWATEIVPAVREAITLTGAVALFTTRRGVPGSRHPAVRAGR